MTFVAPVEVEEPIDEGVPDIAHPWIVVVWNDPVNLMSYVVMVLRKLFGHSKQKATTLMLQVHHEGRAVVADGTREQAEAHVAQLHGYGLWATMEQA
ncbi:MAG: ATP-dependent Clp protease adapter ClpS [Acidimicrobiia bacterium]